MGIELGLFLSEDSEQIIDTVPLGTAVIEDGKAGYGEPLPILAKNLGDTTIIAANIKLQGEGARGIQLARDNNGAHDIWAQPGESIVALAGPEVRPGESFAFWVRAVFTEEDAPEKIPFQFVFDTAGKN